MTHLWGLLSLLWVAAAQNASFSWRDAQAAFRACAGGETPAPREDRYVLWTTRQSTTRARCS